MGDEIRFEKDIGKGRNGKERENAAKGGGDVGRRSGREGRRRGMEKIGQGEGKEGM